MKERRGLLETFFGKRPPQTGTMTQLKMLNGYIPVFSSFDGDAYDSDVVRSVVHAIASNAAKLKPKHVRRTVDGISPADSGLEKLLQVRPNPYMSAYDFYYKLITLLYMKNNAFVYNHTDSQGNTIAFYPVDYNNMEFLEGADGDIYAKFNFMNGRNVTLPYSDLIHLRRFFYKNDLYGESSNRALTPTLDLINTTNQGIVNAIKSSANLRGLLKFTNAMMKTEDLTKERNRFVEEYMDISNNGGVAALDSKAEYIELKGEVKFVDDKQMALIRDNVYRYYNVNEAIVTSKYTEEEWNAFYESVIEPIAIQLSLEFTAKLFTDRERGFGNEIVFEANRLQYASTASKISIIEKLMPTGMLSINEGREIFNLAPVEDGDKRLISLNYIDASVANQYQLDQEAKEKEGGEQNAGN